MGIEFPRAVMFPLFLLVTLISSYSNAWGASGNVTITSPTSSGEVHVSKGFWVNGTYMMTEDATPSTPYGTWVSDQLCPEGSARFAPSYYDRGQGIGDYAYLYSQVDGNAATQIGTVYSSVYGYSALGRSLDFSTYVNINGLDPNATHTVKIYLQDIYGAYCKCSSWWCLYGVYDCAQRAGGIFAQAAIDFRIGAPCTLKISSFTIDRTVIDPVALEKVTFTGNVTETSGKTVSWTLDIKDSVGPNVRTFSGTGKTPSATWDGKDSNGNIVPDGTYTARLLSRTDDGTCMDSKELSITVKTVRRTYLKYVSGDGQEGLVCEELKKPFKVKVSDNSDKPHSDVDVEWKIREGEGASTASIKPESSSTDSDGLAATYLKLGDVAGEYKVDATCSACNEGSPQTFTATAKCQEVPVYDQNDYDDPDVDLYDNWCKLTYQVFDPQKRQMVTKTKNTTCQRDPSTGKLLAGYKQYTIADKGCALTSTAMVISWYKYGGHYLPVDPISLNETMNGIRGGYKEGNFNFAKVKEITEPSLILTFKRDAGKDMKPLQKSDMDKMDEYLKKCIPVIVKVKNIYSNTIWSWHWIVVTKKNGSGYDINDPGYREKTSLSNYEGEIYAIRVYEKDGGICK